jgi:hypothetical protein
VTLTPLHLALGLDGTDLTIELIETACAQRLKEREDLDWKATLPLTLAADNAAGRDAQQEELAKDVAAMANTRGGAIVYGVTEQASAASEIRSVGEPNNETLQNIRRVASNLIFPPITGLTLTWLSSQDGTTVLVLEVPPSTESPHLIRPRRQPAGSGFWFAVPYRNGPDTEWMPEKMIESAYRDRLANRRQRDADIHEMHAELVKTALETAGAAWIVAVARPERPLAARPRTLDATKAREIFSSAWRTGGRSALAGAVAADWVLEEVQPKRGLRRFRQTGSRTMRGPGQSQGHIRAIAEVHHDGSVGLAISRGGAVHPNEHPDKRFLATTDLDQAALSLFTLVRQVARDLQVTSDYDVVLSVESSAGVLFRHPSDIVGVLRDFSESDRVPPFRAVEGAFMISAGLDAAIASLVELAEDAVNQTGVTSRLQPEDIRHAP